MKNQQKKSTFGKKIIASLPSYLNILEITSYVAEKQQDSVQVLKTYASKNRLKAADAECYQQIVEKLESSKKDLKAIEYELMMEFLDEIQPKYLIGDFIKTISGIEQIISQNNNLNFIQEKVTLEIQKGFLYIISIWDNIILENDGPLDEVIRLHKMKTEWQGKVKLVAISLKASSEEILELVTKKNMQCMDHYKLIKKNKGHQFLDMLNIEEFPFAIVIGKDGKIIYTGYHYEVNLDNLITQEMVKEDGDVPQQLISNDNKELNVSKGQEQQNKSTKDQNSQQLNNDISQVSKNQMEDQKSQLLEEINQQHSERINKETQLQNVNAMKKGQLKVLKQYLQDIQKVLKDLKFEEKFQITLRRQRIVRSDGAFMIEQISELDLEYIITSQELENLHYFLEQVWDKIPEHLRIVTQSEVVGQSNIKNRIQMAFAKQGVLIQYLPNLKTTITWHSNLEKMEINISEGFQVQQRGLNLEKFYDGILKAKPSIDFLSQRFDLKEQFNEIIEELRSNVTLGPGQKFAPILNYKVFGSSKKQKIIHFQGDVLVIMYWKCNKDCITQLRQVDKIIKKNNEVWGKIVKFVALNIGDEKEYIEFLEQNQELVSGLQIYHKEMVILTDTSLYGVTQVPYFILVDKSGFIRYVNSPVNLERSIQQLVKENQNEKDTYRNMLKEPIQELSLDLIKKIISKDDFKKQLLSFDKDKVIEVKLDFEAQKVGKANVFQNIYLNYFIRDKQEEEFNKLLDQIFSIIPEDRWIIKKQIQQTISIEYPGNKCAVCQKDISIKPKQYYCYFKNEHVCVECAEYTDIQKQGKDMYKYHDTLIFINGPLQDESVLRDIDSHKIGKNRQLQDGQVASQKHDFQCDGCIVGSEGPRYIAVNAKPGSYKMNGYIDYCKNCFLVLKNKDSTKAKNIIAKNSDQGMTADNIFTRVLFNYGKYREF